MVIDLVHDYPARLTDWSHEDIKRASQHVWNIIRKRTRGELQEDFRTFFNTTHMPPDFQSKVLATLMRSEENNRTLAGDESGERLMISHLFKDRRIVTFDLRMKGVREVQQAFRKAQKMEPLQTLLATP